MFFGSSEGFKDYPGIPLWTPWGIPSGFARGPPGESPWGSPRKPLGDTSGDTGDPEDTPGLDLVVFSGSYKDDLESRNHVCD